MRNCNVVVKMHRLLGLLRSLVLQQISEEWITNFARSARRLKFSRSISHWPPKRHRFLRHTTQPHRASIDSSSLRFPLFFYTLPGSTTTITAAVHHRSIDWELRARVRPPSISLLSFGSCVHIATFVWCVFIYKYYICYSYNICVRVWVCSIVIQYTDMCYVCVHMQASHTLWVCVCVDQAIATNRASCLDSSFHAVCWSQIVSSNTNVELVERCSQSISGGVYARSNQMGKNAAMWC